MTLEELYVAYRNVLLKKLIAFSRDAHAAEDAVQQAYLSALAHDRLADFSDEAAKAWLYVTARNALIDEKRKMARRIMLDPDIEIPLEEPDKDDMLFLRELLEKLPQDHKQIVSLRYLSGLDSAAIGRILGIPSATVRTRLRAALATLRNETNLPNNVR